MQTEASFDQLGFIWHIIEAAAGLAIVWGLSTLRKTVAIVDKLSFVVLGVDGKNGHRSKIYNMKEALNSITKRIDQHDNTFQRFGDRIEAVETKCQITHNPRSLDAQL